MKTPPRLPNATEQQALDGLLVRPIRPQERDRWQQLMAQQHYLGAPPMVGEQLRYVATFRGRWLALLGWCAGAYHLAGREAWIGWSAEQRQRRLPFVANNARFLILPDCHFPNLASRALSRCTARLAADWQRQYGHPVWVVESFVDRQRFRGTAYRCAGWEAVGRTAGFGRVAEDFYVAHERPKELWVKALHPEARTWLRAESLPAEWAAQETPLRPRCREAPEQLSSLVDELRRAVPEQRDLRGLRHKQATVLAIVFLAIASGMRGGYRGPAEYARGLSQAQRRRLRCWRHPRTGRYEAPGEGTFLRVLGSVPPALVGAALRGWQARRLGGPPAEPVAIDGKALRGSGGVALLGAMGHESGRWLAVEPVAAKTNEIPVARTMLERLEIEGRVVTMDALHTQTETARAVVQEHGGEYVLTIKDNQPTLRKTAEVLLPASFPPCAGSDREGARADRDASDRGDDGDGDATGVSLCGATGAGGAGDRGVQERENQP
jgi:hypothetical protein